MRIAYLQLFKKILSPIFRFPAFLVQFSYLSFFKFNELSRRSNALYSLNYLGNHKRYLKSER